jgi:hypothetical protein
VFIDLSLLVHRRGSHTFTIPSPSRDVCELKPLYKLRRLGLAPLVKEIQVVQTSRMWLVPWAFDSRDFGCFSDFANVQTLTFECLEISLFMPDVERYFGHFPPTLRSLTLSSVPLCTPRHLSHFLSLFPNLDDIAIWQFSMHRHNLTPPIQSSFRSPRRGCGGGWRSVCLIRSRPGRT